MPHRPVAIVLGAGLYADGSPTPMLADRVEAAAGLYRAGTVDHLLMSGDNSRADYDEPAAMRRLALESGVPAEAITVDDAGFSTYDTCARATPIFGVRSAVIVTNDFHVARAVYACRGLGIDAVGLSVNTSAYSRADVTTQRLRELAASVKAVWEVGIAHPSPRFGGPFEGLGPPTSDAASRPPG